MLLSSYQGSRFWHFLREAKTFLKWKLGAGTQDALHIHTTEYYAIMEPNDFKFTATTALR